MVSASAFYTCNDDIIACGISMDADARLRIWSLRLMTRCKQISGDLNTKSVNFYTTTIIISS
uniref:WD_REPEATS_REGION domain-containing protein n=1 Tax=Heterorhabditis bacteriophora TaxID=37862 RepID=A0A1I7X1Z9_HETBA